MTPEMQEGFIPEYEIDMPEYFAEDKAGYEKWCDERDVPQATRNLLVASKLFLNRIDSLDDLKAVFVIKDCTEMGVFRVALQAAARQYMDRGGEEHGKI